MSDAQSKMKSISWKKQAEEPLNRWYRYPIARVLVRVLVRTSITPNQVSAMQVVFAAMAAILLTYPGYKYIFLAVLVFEVRSILDCVDGSLARAKNIVTAGGHAIDAFADWLGVFCLYIGLYFRLQHHDPWTVGSVQITPSVVLFLALLQAGVRSFASDYFIRKFGFIFELNSNLNVPSISQSSALDNKSFFGKLEALIQRTGQLVFEQNPSETSYASPLNQDLLVSTKKTKMARMLAFLWSISNGDAFLSFLMITALFNQLWWGQIIAATFGSALIVIAIAISIYALNRAQRQARTVVI